MNTPLSLLTAALAVAVATTSAIAGPGKFQRGCQQPARGPVAFESMDLDRNGIVTAAEHAQHRAQRQAQRAAQGYPMRRAHRAPRFEQIDANQDAGISREELAAWQNQRMRRLGSR